ncbi:MAG TPA: hypothetical protein ENG63_07500 [Candidatus Desulfofervidus auxilii]|uniref:Uncharacterized protein n=1 Tax=Desulfofervidus auxilii TaxID=1621989 RepID=A0A7C0Y345_DESA2|nr:hypothetical protein [Candidatus Desulfofervidus auxilii]
MKKFKISKLIFKVIIIFLIFTGIAFSNEPKNYFGFGLFVIMRPIVVNEILPGQLYCTIPIRNGRIIYAQTYCFLVKHNYLYRIKVPGILYPSLVKFLLKPNKDLEAEIEFINNLGKYLNYGFIEFERIKEIHKLR